MQIEDKTKKLSLNERINKIWATTQGKTYTTAIATIVVVALMIVFAVVPAYVSITDQISLNEAKTTYVGDLKTKQQNLNTLITQQQNNTVSLRLLDIYLRDRINNELLVASFSQIALEKNINCKFDSASFTEPAVSKKIKLLNANVKAVGFSAKFICKFGVIKDLYDRILNLPVPMNIDNISYSNNKALGGGGNSAYFFDKFAVTYDGEYYYWAGTSLDITTSTTSGL